MSKKNKSKTFKNHNDINDINYLKVENLRLRKIIESLKETIKKFDLEKNPMNQINILKKFHIQTKNKIIIKVSFFPCGNFVLISINNIQIWSLKDQKIIQEIKNEHKENITSLSIKNDNFFITSSLDLSIKIWSKNSTNNKFICSETISNVHSSSIIKIYIEPISNNIYSCSFDETLKIWNKPLKSNKYQNITVLPQENGVCTFLIINEYNYLVTSGVAGTIFYDYTTYNIIKIFQDIKSYNQESMKLFNYNKIIIGDRNLSIINLINMEIVIEIFNVFDCWCICVLDEVFLTGGSCQNIRIYRKDNYELINTIYDAHKGDINGIVEINFENYQLYSYSNDGTINFYKIEKNFI